MREVTIKNNQTNKKLYVNQDMDFTQIPEAEITLIAIFYEEIIVEKTCFNMAFCFGCMYGKLRVCQSRGGRSSACGFKRGRGA